MEPFKSPYEAACRMIEERDRRITALEAKVERLREALAVIRDCPPDAVHLMPLAADAALTPKEDPQ